MADTEDLKSSGPKGRAGSSPALGIFSLIESMVCEESLHKSSKIFHAAALPFSISSIAAAARDVLSGVTWL